jgi:hypothetical protein
VLDIKLTLRPLAAETPVDQRLANLLKTALRRDRLRCVAIEEVPAGAPKARSHRLGVDRAAPAREISHIWRLFLGRMLRKRQSCPAELAGP